MSNSNKVCIIDHRAIILMLNGLSSADGVTITEKNGDKVINIPKGIFKKKVNEVATISSQEYDLSQQKQKIIECLDSGTTTFIVDYPGVSLSDGTIQFTIIITPNAAGGRRSKARRTKKGTRKGKTAKKRGHRRS
jgi:hypothetical protein